MKLKRVLKSLLVFLIVTIGVYALYFNKKLVSEFDKIEQPIDDENDSLEDNNEVIDNEEKEQDNNNIEENNTDEKEQDNNHIENNNQDDKDEQQNSDSNKQEEVIDKVEINKPVENKPSNEEDKEPVEEQPLTQAQLNNIKRNELQNKYSITIKYGNEFTYGVFDSSKVYNQINNKYNTNFVNSYAQTNRDEDIASTFEDIMSRAYKPVGCYDVGSPIYNKVVLINKVLEDTYECVKTGGNYQWNRFIR